MPTMSMGSAASITAEGTRHVQPGDGSCLFHSLMAAVTLLGLQLQSRICTAISLRRILLRWLVAHTSKSYMGMTFTSWLRAERQQPKLTMAAYARRMQNPTEYGGALEIAAFVHSQPFDVWVWKPLRGGKRYERTAVFDCAANKPSQGRQGVCALKPEL